MSNWIIFYVNKSFYWTSVQNCNNDIDIFGQEWKEADLFFMNESSISNISREGIRMQALSGMILSFHKFNAINSSLNYGLDFPSTNCFVFVEKLVLPYILCFSHSLFCEECICRYQFINCNKDQMWWGDELICKWFLTKRRNLLLEQY